MNGQPDVLTLLILLQVLVSSLCLDSHSAIFRERSNSLQQKNMHRSQAMPKHNFPIPRSYKFLRVLGQGSFGTVIECKKRKNGKSVAIKVNKRRFRSQNWEAIVMLTLMRKNMHNYNIVKYEGAMFSKWSLSLVYEVLDISLCEYLRTEQTQMKLHDIQSVIKQMAEAFLALESVGVIHTDVKTDNIMMVDRQREPLRVKLIDFGLAIFSWQTKLHSITQAPSIAAPEVILGLPITSAIDIWSLGCTMGTMLLGVKLFPGRLYHEVLRNMMELLGDPPTRLLRHGKKTKLSFSKTLSGWRPLVHEKKHRRKKMHNFQCLDEMKEERRELDNPMEAEERNDCVELLKTMLQWDSKKRITASGILNHPFITKEYRQDWSHGDHSTEIVLTSSTDESPYLEQNKEESPKHLTPVQPENGCCKELTKDALCITTVCSIPNYGDCQHEDKSSSPISFPRDIIDQNETGTVDDGFLSRMLESCWFCCHEIDVIV